MTASGLRIVLAGSVGSSRLTLQALLRHRANVVGVLELQPDVPSAISGFARLNDVAAEANVPCVGFQKLNEPEIVSQVREWQPDLLFVVGLSQLVKAELLSVPKLACVGFHPTLLPRGRGRAPVAWLVLDAVPEHAHDREAASSDESRHTPASAPTATPLSQAATSRSRTASRVASRELARRSPAH